MKQTDLKEIKEISKILFDAVTIEPLKECPFVCQHPFTTTTQVLVKDGEKAEMIDITTGEGYSKFRKHLFWLIDECEDLSYLMMILNKAYYMTFLKFTNQHMSNKDFGKLLAECWTIQEFPSRDPNVNLRELISWFKKADKHSLMSKEDYEVYKGLLIKKGLTVYRGVSLSGSPEGLSWTTDLEKAKWFAHRFNSNGSSRIYKMTITNPNHILAYLNDRGENEVVVDTVSCHNWEVI